MSKDLSLLERQVECTEAALGMRIFVGLAFRREERITTMRRPVADRSGSRFSELVKRVPASCLGRGAATCSACTTAAAPSSRCSFASACSPRGVSAWARPG